MNLCVAIGNLKYSGAENVMNSLLKEFKKKNHNVSIMLINQEENSVVDNMRVYGCYVRETSKVKRRIQMLYKVYKVLKLNQFDTVISFGFATSTFVLPAAKIAGIKSIHCERTNPQYDLRRRVDRWMQKLLIPLATGYIFQTQEIRDEFSKKIQARSVIIHNPVRQIVNDSLDYDNKEKIIVTASRLDNRVKNHILLIQAFAYVSKFYPEYRLFIFGDGNDKALYEQLIHERKLEKQVILCGESYSVVEAIKNADIFVFTSNYEGMPNALIEALSVGLPCITTDFHGGAARELIQNDVNGVIIPVNGQKELEEELIHLIPDIERKKRLGMEARKICESHSLEKISGEWLRFIEMVSETRG